MDSGINDIKSEVLTNGEKIRNDNKCQSNDNDKVEKRNSNSITSKDNNDEIEEIKNDMLKLKEENLKLKQLLEQFEAYTKHTQKYKEPDNISQPKENEVLSHSTENDEIVPLFEYGRISRDDDVVQIQRINKKNRLQDCFEDFNLEDLSKTNILERHQSDRTNKILRIVDVSNNEIPAVNTENDTGADIKQELSTTGSISGVTPGDVVDAKINYETLKGHNISLSAQHNKHSGNILSAQGTINILDTATQNLEARAFVEKELPSKFSEGQTRLGGSVDYLHSNGHNIQISSQQDLFEKLIYANTKVTLFNNGVHNFSTKASFLRSVAQSSMGRSTNSFCSNLDYKHQRTGHSASFAAQHLPNFAKQISVTGKLNVYRNNNHSVEALAKFTRTFPTVVSVKKYNVYSALLDYNFRDTIGITLGVKHSNFNGETNYSIGGFYSLFSGDNTNIDVNVGLNRCIISQLKDSFEPTFGITFRKSF